MIPVGSFFGGAFYGGGFFGAGNPVGGSAQENPVIRKQEGSLTVGVNLLLTTLAVAAITVVPREAVVTPLTARAAIQHDVGRTSLALTNVPAGASPFLPVDWQNPQAGKAQQHEVGQQALALYNPPVVASPFFPPVFDNPASRKSGQAEQTQNRLPIEARPFATGAMPDRLSAPVSAQQDVGRQSLALANVPAGSPFSQGDWPNPLGVRQAQQPERSESLALSTVVAVASPFSQTDWPVPVFRVAIGGRDSGFEDSGLALSVPVVATPFVIPQWEVSRGLGWSQQQQAPRSIALDVVVPVGTPFVPVSWQNPAGIRHPSQWTAQNLLPLQDVTPVPPTVTPPGPAGRSTHGKRKIVIGDRVYEVDSLRDVDLLLKRVVRQEAEPVTQAAKARIRVVDRVSADVEAAAPVDLPMQSVEVDWSALWMQLAMQDAAYADILAKVLEKQEEDDIETLLLTL